MGQRAAERLAQETELRQAIDGGALRVFYQPIVDLSSGRIREVEALVRWQHPQRGIVSPADFIPLAEETGLIVPLGRWVLDEACRQLSAWHREQPSVPPLVLSVNLSARQLQQPDLTEYVGQLLATYALPPSCVTLEITESCLMQDNDAAPLRTLAALGVNLAIDDFGTGYSSLSYLRDLPVDTLKIDRSFVAGLDQDQGSQAIIRAIATLAHELGLVVTAEGIETAEQLAQIRALGIDLAQGYYLNRPVPLEQLDFHSTPQTAEFTTASELKTDADATSVLQM
jgi:Amt family ammonium transporter